MRLKIDPVREAVQIYRWLLFVYPRSFRAKYGKEMIDLFESIAEGEHRRGGILGIGRALATVLREAIPTAMQEHAAAAKALFDRLPLGRLALASMLPLAAYLLLLRQTTGREDAAVITLWFACWAAAVLRSRGHGTRCLTNAAWAGAAGVCAALACELFLGSSGSFPVLWPAAVLALLGATSGLMLGAYVRAIMEGVTIHPLPLLDQPVSAPG